MLQMTRAKKILGTGRGRKFTEITKKINKIATLLKLIFVSNADAKCACAPYW
jgi:hypothetical protein